MTTTTLTTRDAANALKKISIKSIKDIRALDVDLLLELTNGDRIIISGGAVAALATPDLQMEFVEGALSLGHLFQQIDQIQLSPEANLTVASKGITRYNQNNAKVAKSADQQEEEEGGDKLVVTNPGENEPSAATSTHAGMGNASESEFPSIKVPDSQKEIASIEANSAKEESWSKVWPIATGLLAALAAAGGKGGSGAAAAAETNPNTSTGALGSAKVSGYVALGSMNDATATLYGDKGQVLGKGQVVNGQYEAELSEKNYKGAVLVVITDNTPDLPNYADEASKKYKDLGSTSLRSLFIATGANQSANVTALTELAALRVLPDTDKRTAAGLSQTDIVNANKSVGRFWGADILQTEVIPTYVLDPNTNKVVANKAFTATLDSAIKNQAYALQAISSLETVNTLPTDAVLAKLTTNLQPLVIDPKTGTVDPTQLQWATNPRTGLTTPDATKIQAQLFAETVSPDKQAELLKIPATAMDGIYKTLADYFTQNHIAIVKPEVLVKNADPSKPAGYQTIGADQSLILDKDDLIDGNLAVKGPIGATVTVTLVGKTVTNNQITVSLTSATVDDSGVAAFKMDKTKTDELAAFLSKFQGAWSASDNVTATVTIKDGNNSRTNYAAWADSASVQVDVKSTPSTAVKTVSLLNDTFYAGDNAAAGAPDKLKTGSASDNITTDASVRIELSQALQAGEQIQYALGTLVGDTLTWGDWITRNDITKSAGSVATYEVSKVTSVNQTVQIKARVVTTGGNFSGGVGNASDESAPIAMTIDTKAPMAAAFTVVGGDDGKSTTDGILLTANKKLIIPATNIESGAEIHYKFSGDGTVTLKRANGDTVAVNPNTWTKLQAGDTFTLNGDTRNASGKFVIDTRQVDLAGNFTDAKQTYVVDTAGAVEIAVALANLNLAVQRAQTKLDERLASGSASSDEIQALRDVLNAATTDQQAAIRAASQPYSSTTANSTLFAATGNKLTAAGVSNLPDAYLKAAINTLATQNDPEQVNTKAALQGLVNQAVAKADAALTVIRTYDGTNTVPTEQHFKDLGVDGVTATNLPFINRGLAVLPEASSNAIPQVEATVNAYNKVLALADGRANSASTVLTPTEVAALGITLDGNAPVNPATAQLLGTVIDTLKPADIDSITKLNTMAQAASRIIAVAAGDANASTLSVGDFTALGVVGVEDILGDVATALSALHDSSKADTLAEVAALVNNVLGPLKEIINYATDSILNPAPSLAVYQSRAELKALINNGNLDAVNTAIDALDKSSVSSWPKVTAIVQTYNRVIEAANGKADNGAASLNAADYARLGVTNLDKTYPGEGTQKTSALTLLNNTVDALSFDGVNTVAKLNALAGISARVVQQAAGIKLEGSSQLTAKDLGQLGVTVPSGSGLELMLAGIKGTADDGSGVTTKEAILAAAQAAQAALARITVYADDHTKNPAPSASDYQALGIDGVKGVNGASDTSITSAMATTLNTSLAAIGITGTSVGTPSKLQALATAYARILAEVGDTANNNTDPTQSDYTAIGADAAPSSNNALALLNSALDKKAANSGAADTLTKVNALIAAANSMAALAAGNTNALVGDTDDAKSTDLRAKLALLGITGPDAPSLAAIQAAIVLAPDDGSTINSYDRLQTVVTNAIRAQQHVKAYAGTGGTGDAPVDTTFTDMGVSLPAAAEVKAAIVAALNTVIHSGSVTAADVSAPKLVQAMMDAYARVLKAADGSASNTDPADRPTAADYAALKITPLPPAAADGQPASALKLLNDAIDALRQIDVNTYDQLNGLSDVVARLMAVAAGQTKCIGRRPTKRFGWTPTACRTAKWAARSPP